MKVTVRNVHKISYDAVNRILEPATVKSRDRPRTLDLVNHPVEETYDSLTSETPSTSPSAALDLHSLHKLATQLRRRRLDRQGFDYYIPGQACALSASRKARRRPATTRRCNTVLHSRTLKARLQQIWWPSLWFSLDLWQGDSARFDGWICRSGEIFGRTSLRSLFQPGRRPTNPRGILPSAHGRCKTPGRHVRLCRDGVVLQTAPVAVTPLNHWAPGIHSTDTRRSGVTSPCGGSTTCWYIGRSSKCRGMNPGGGSGGYAEEGVLRRSPRSTDQAYVITAESRTGNDDCPLSVIYR